MKNVSYHKLYDIPKQHHNEVNEIRAERLARNANLLALVAQQQPVYHHQNHTNQYTQNSSTKSQQAAIRNRGKAIVNSSTPTYNQEPAMVADDDEMSKEKEIDKIMALISLSFKKIYKPTNNNLITSSNTSRANQDNSPRINRRTGYDNQRVVNVAGARETVGTQKPKRAKDAAYHKEKMLLCKQEEDGFQLNAEQDDWRDGTDDEPDNQELEAHYMYMSQIQEVTPDAADNSGPIFDTKPLQKVQNDDDNYNVFANDQEHPVQPKSVNDTYLVEQGDTNITIDSLDMSTNKETVDQDDDDDLANERDLLASLINKIKCEIDDSKNQANNELSKTNQLMFKDLKKIQDELEKRHDVNYMSKVELECAKAKTELMSYKTKSQKSINNYSYQINDLNQKISDMKKELVAHQETIAIMSQQKEDQTKAYKTREEKELEKVIALENKIKVLDDIVYKTGQSVQTMNMLNRFYNDNLALMLAPESDETIRLAQESQSKLSDLIRPFDYEKLNNLYIKEEVYVCQPPGFEDPDFPDRVYKVEKALYGLHQAPRAWVKGDILLVQVYVDDIIFRSTKKVLCTEFEKLMHKKFQMSSMGELTFFLGLQVIQKDDGIFISQDKYVDEILNKFGFSTVKTASTPMETSKPLMKDKSAEDVDVYLYRSMIGSLMYLTSSRPGQPKLGLWYPRDSPFDLEAYTDSDYAGASLDKKSTTGGCQFLRSRLISWQCKKQTIVANSTTEAEYVAAASCCGQVLWIQNQMLDYGYNFMNTKIYIDNESTICIVKNPVFHSKTKHIEIRHHFIRDSNEKKLIQMSKIHTDHNVADLLTKAFDTQKPRKAKKTTEISQSSGPIPYTSVANETLIKEWEDRMERALRTKLRYSTASSLEAEQDSGEIYVFCSGELYLQANYTLGQANYSHGQANYTHRRIIHPDVFLRQELLEYMAVHVNDASESSKPSWGKRYFSKSEQVKTQKIQAGVQVSRLEDKDVIFSIGSA
ncbi:retrovirus-related pol polyprotein from transposon TNT 1-94 [Tanacetum coccineum]